MRSKGSLFSHNNLQTASFFSVLDGYRQFKPQIDTRLIFSGRGQDRNKLILVVICTVEQSFARAMPSNMMRSCVET